MALDQDNRLSEQNSSLLTDEEILCKAEFQIADHAKPTVEATRTTSGILLGGYSEADKIAFIASFFTIDDVKSIMLSIINKISQLSKTEIRSPVQLHIRSYGNSINEIETIRILIREKIGLLMEIVSNSEFSDALTLSIDSRNGTVSEFKPKCEIQSLSLEAPAFRSSGGKIVEVLQSEVGFTIATDEKPIIATYGCAPCIALGAMIVQIKLPLSHIFRMQIRLENLEV
ncbi:MAG: hypothetical protein QRY74_05390 [Chlamydia sp.]